MRSQPADTREMMTALERDVIEAGGAPLLSFA
jgi:hypothetical protein